MAQVEVAREGVLELLPKLNEEELAEIAEGLSLQIKEPKSGGKSSRKSILLNTLRRHVTSEELEDEDDQGLQVLGQMYTHLEEKTRKDDEYKDADADITREMLEEELMNDLQALKMKAQLQGEDEVGESSVHGNTDILNALEEIKMRQNWNKTNLQQELETATSNKDREVEERLQEVLAAKTSLKQKQDGQLQHLVQLYNNNQQQQQQQQ